MASISTALVVGGGIAGPVAALALRRAGIEATVCEAYPTAADGVGGVLTLAPNGLAALGVVGLGEAVTGIGHYGMRLTSAVTSPDGVTAQFADGRTVTADVLIGADGIRSTVRTLIDPAAPAPEYTGLLGFGVPGDGPIAGVAGESGTMHFAFGKRAFFGYWTQPDGSTALFCNLPHEQPMTLAEVRQVPAEEWLRRLREAHRGDYPAEQVLARASAGQLLLAGPLEMMPPVPHWYRDRLVLTGDSVHAPSSSSGQGASLSIESAIELARCLRDASSGPAAFAVYERQRRARVEKIAANAKKTNNNKASGPLAKKVMGVVAPIALKTFLKPEKMFGPVHRYRIDWDDRVAGVPDAVS